MGHTLGRLCVERGLVTQEQLARCLQIQKSGEAWRHLGEILLNEGYLTGIALANLLSLQEAKRRGVKAGGGRSAPTVRTRSSWVPASLPSSATGSAASRWKGPRS
jgi:hypothetical protein